MVFEKSLLWIKKCAQYSVRSLEKVGCGYVSNQVKGHERSALVVEVNSTVV